MKQHDFSELSDYEFEEIVNDLISKTHGIPIERFARGRDYGIDGRSYKSGQKIIIQSKHYVKTGYNGLKSAISKNEYSKILLLKPSRYILSTSVSLSVGQVDELKAIIAEAVPGGTVDVYGQEKLNEFLRDRQDVLKAHYKLWACSAGTLELFLSPEIESRQKALKSRLNTLNKHFVVTEDVKPISEVLKDEHVAIITGEPGVGKTTLAEYICQQYLKIGYKIHVIESDFSIESINLLNAEEKVVYYFDDFLGSNYYDAIRGREDSAIVRFISQIKLEKNKRVILTSRSNIIRKAGLLSQSFQLYGIQRKKYVIEIKNHSEITKAKILYNHLWHGSVENQQKLEIVRAKKYKSIINHTNFNPRIISFIVDSYNFANSNVHSYFEFISKNLNEPSQVWDHCYTAQIDEQLRILAKLVVASGGEIEEDVLRTSYDRALREYDFTRIHNEPIEYDHTIKLGCESILSRNITIDKSGTELVYISHFNPSVTDYILPKIANAVDGRKLYRSLQTDKVIEQYISLFRNRRISQKESAKLLNSIFNELDIRQIDRNIILLLKFGCEINLQSTKMDDFVESIKSKLENRDIEVRTVRDSIRSIVIAHLNDYDWNTVIKSYLEEICLTDDEYFELFNAYEGSKFEENDVLASIKKCLVNYIIDTAEDLLTTDDDFAECTDIREGEKYLNTAIEELSNRFPILEEQELDRVAKSINIDSLIQRNIERLDERSFERDYEPDDDEPRINEVEILFDGFNK